MLLMKNCFQFFNVFGGGGGPNTTVRPRGEGPLRGREVRRRVLSEASGEGPLRDPRGASSSLAPVWQQGDDCKRILKTELFDIAYSEREHPTPRLASANTSL